MWNKNPMIFYCKEEIKTWQGYDKRTYQKLVLNRWKIIGNSTSIYTYSTFSSRKFKKKTPNLHVAYVHMCVAHVYPCVNYELSRRELGLNQKWIKNELEVN